MPGIDLLLSDSPDAWNGRSRFGPNSKESSTESGFSGPLVDGAHVDGRNHWFLVRGRDGSRNPGSLAGQLRQTRIGY